jgi:hypothetical protein
MGKVVVCCCRCLCGARGIWRRKANGERRYRVSELVSPKDVQINADVDSGSFWVLGSGFLCLASCVHLGCDNG